MDIKYFNSMKKIRSSKILISTELFSNLNQNKIVAESLINELKVMNREFKLKHILKENKFSAKKLINNALKIGLSLTDKNINDNFSQKKKNVIIKEIKEKAKTLYITNKSETNKKNLNEEFQEILDKCNDKTRIKLDKYFDSLIEAKNEQTNIIIENQNLEKEMKNLNNESIILKRELSEKNFEINKIIKKLEVFEKIKPFFELIRQFPNEEPKQIMGVFFNNKKNLIYYLHKLNKMNEEHEEINRMRDKEQIKEKKFKDNILEKIKEENLTFNTKNQIMELDILNLERTFDSIQKNSLEAMKDKKLLLHIYNVIKKFIPEKNYNLFITQLGYNPLYSHYNFDPSIFSNKLFVNLIQECIVNKASECNEGKLLRNTIVFGNYLARKYLNKNKYDNYRYNPIKTFKDLKSFFDKINIKNYSLKNQFINLKHKFNELEKEKNHLENILINSKIKYNQFLDKLEISKSEKKINQKINENKIIKDNKLKHLNRGKKLKSVLNLKTLEIVDNNEEKTSENFNYKNKDKDKVFITDVHKLLKRNKTIYKSNLSNENNENTKDKLSSNTISSQNKNKKLKVKNNILKLKNLINFKLSLSKNKDKLYTINGVKRGYELYANLHNLIKQLIKEEKIDIFNCKKKRNKLKIETNENSHLKKTFFSDKNKILKKNKTEMFQRPFSSDINNYKKISNQILSDIDKMIDSIKNIGKNNVNKE